VLNELIAQRYRIIGKAGEGALSVVYRAHDERLDRDVALKVLKEGPGLDRHAAERFDAEARAAARIQDVHVVAIYDVIKCELGRAIVMEFVDGPSLFERLKVCGTLQEAAVISYARQIAQALIAAHAGGVLHRDVKPGNVLLTSDDTVKVVDFGLVKALDGTGATLTQSGMFVGSVQYVSPEQAQGQQLSPASDLYSLGVLIYEMRAGTVPYPGESPVAIALAHVTNPPPTRKALERNMSPALAAIVERLLNKDPQRRYASAAELAAALDAISPASDLSRARSSANTEAPTIISPILRFKQARRRFAAPAGLAAFFASWRARAVPTMRERFATDRILLGRLIEKGRSLEGSDRRRAAIVACGILLILIALLAGPAVALVPNVYGKPLTQATALLTHSGLRASVRERPSRTLAPGIIVAQSPSAGSHLSRGSAVQIVESSGLPFVAVPRLTGLSVAAARQVLHQIDLQARLGAIVSDQPPYTIVEQAPSAGARLREGTAMMVVFAIPQAPPAYAQSAPYEAIAPRERRAKYRGHGPHG